VELEVLSIVFGNEIDPDEVKASIAKKLPGALVQTVNSKAAANGAYVDMIVAQTLRAKGAGGLLARKPEVDLLLRLARTTQISRAIELVGAKKGKPFLLVVVGHARKVEGVYPDVLRRGMLPRHPLSTSELEKIESAALLNVEKA